MEYLILYIASILISIGMDFDFALQVSKDIVDSGGKLNIEKISEIYRCISETNKKISKFAKFIPIFNIAYPISNRLLYETRRNDILMELDMIGAIDQLTEEEKEEYSKKPTRFNALMTMCKTPKKEVNKEVVFAKKLDSVPTCEEEYPANKLVLTIDDSAYEIEGDTIDEQFENVYLYLDTYEKLLSCDKYSDNEELQNLSAEERKRKIEELKLIKKNLLKMQKTINKNEKILRKQKK